MVQKNINIEKIAFKVVQFLFLVMYTLTEKTWVSRAKAHVTTYTCDSAHVKFHVWKHVKIICVFLEHFHVNFHVNPMWNYVNPM